MQVPPPIPEKVFVSSYDGAPPPLPPRSKSIDTSLAQGLPTIIKPAIPLPLPQPPPQPSPQPSPLPNVSITNIVPGKEAVIKETTTLSKLSENPEKLPAVIRVVDGYYGQTSRFSFSAGECFQAHFLKHSKVLNVKAGGGRKYSVPLTSTMKLGLIHEGSESCLNQISTADLLGMKTPPHVVSVLTCADKGKKDKGKIGGGDQLIIKQRKQRSLSCFNLTTGADVDIKSTFHAIFSADPNATKIHPLEMAQHLTEVFPCHAIVFKDNSSQITRGSLEGKVIVIQGCSTEICVVCKELYQSRGATTANTEEEDFIHLPAHGNIGKLRFDILDTDDKQQLYDQAYEFMENFQPSAGITYTDAVTDDAFDIQSCLYQDIRSNLHNYELLNNVTDYRQTVSKEDKNTGVSKSPSAQQLEILDSHGSEYAVIDQSTRKKKCAQPASKPRRSKSVSTSTTSQKAHTTTDASTEYMPIPDLPTRVNLLPPHDSPPLSPLSEPVIRRNQFSSITGPPPTPPRPRPRPKPHSNLQPEHNSTSPAKPTDSYTTLYPPHLITPVEEHYEVIPGQLLHIQKENRDFLKSLNPDQILQLLDGLHMSQYKKRFEEEMIGGDILIDCDDITLEKELGVTMKIHRLKLHKLITGDTSAKKLISPNIV